MDEQELVAAARSGNEDAFQELYRRHVKAVRRLGWCMLKTTDLDDFCQDTFTNVFLGLEGFEETCTVRTWVARIAMNEARMILRRRRRGSGGELPRQLASMDEVLERCAFAQEDRELEGVPARFDVHKLLQGVTEKQRRLLEMAYVDGISNREIAVVLGVSLNRVKCLLRHARQRMRDLAE
jgi:RNA polymerase sigma-70 factor, ECF subfamily